MNMREAFERNQAEIAQGVVVASQLHHVQGEKGRCLQTFIREHKDGSVSIYQPGAHVTLTPSQVQSAVDRLAVAVLRAQARAART